MPTLFTSDGHMFLTTDSLTPLLEHLQATYDTQAAAATTSRDADTARSKCSHNHAHKTDRRNSVASGVWFQPV